jgi:F-type H+-transporting ATPase subunit delta
MSARTTATRYAKALFDVALAENTELAKVGRDLADVTALVTENPELNEAAQRPGVPDQARIALMEQLADRLGVTTQVKKLVVVLTRGRKLELLTDLAAAYNERLLAHQNIVRAEVRSAAPLSAEKTKALENSLSKVTGKTVELSVEVDPSLLGGVVAKIGSTVYDGSVKTQLERLRHELVEQAS